MTRVTLRGHRAASAVVLLVGGGAIAAATWASVGGGWALATFAIYACLALVAYVWAGRSGDIAAIMRAGGDERQRGLDRDATAYTGMAVVTFAIIGAIIELARTGNPGNYGLLCGVAGAAYVISLVVLGRRR